jgi:hypothetical protein
MVSRKMKAPTERDWMAVKRIFRYLCGTVNFGLEYGSNRMVNGVTVVLGLADADWASSELDRKSRSGHTIFVNGDLVSWYSKLQPGVPSKSTVESEYRSAGAATREMMWLKNVCEELKLETGIELRLLQDNQGAISATKNPTQHSRLKHIDLEHHFIREVVKEKKMEISYCSTDEMIADIQTKPLGREKYEYFRKAMGMMEVEGLDLGEELNLEDQDFSEYDSGVEIEETDQSRDVSSDLEET